MSELQPIHNFIYEDDHLYFVINILLYILSFILVSVIAYFSELDTRNKCDVFLTSIYLLINIWVFRYIINFLILAFLFLYFYIICCLKFE